MKHYVSKLSKHALIFDEVNEVAVLLLAHGGLKRDGVLGDLEHALNLLNGHPEGVGELL